MCTRSRESAPHSTVTPVPVRPAFRLLIDVARFQGLEYCALARTARSRKKCISFRRPRSRVAGKQLCHAAQSWLLPHRNAFHNKRTMSGLGRKSASKSEINRTTEARETSHRFKPNHLLKPSGDTARRRTPIDILARRFGLSSTRAANTQSLIVR